MFKSKSQIVFNMEISSNLDDINLTPPQPNPQTQINSNPDATEFNESSS